MATAINFVPSSQPASPLSRVALEILSFQEIYKIKGTLFVDHGYGRFSLNYEYRRESELVVATVERLSADLEFTRESGLVMSPEFLQYLVQLGCRRLALTGATP
jgi:hypothetical protein